MNAGGKVQKAIDSVRLRPGERDTVDIVHQVIALPDGTSAAAIGVDLLGAPVPERRYVADVVSVAYSKGMVKLIFAQECISGAKLRSMIVLQMTPHAVAQFLRSLTNMSNPGIDEIARRMGAAPEDLLSLENFVEPEQTVAFAANMIGAAVSGMEACLDVYNASTFSVLNVGAKSKIPVDAVVRINLRLPSLLAIREALVQLEPQFPPELVSD